jgi:hypothetical protein
MEAFGILVLFVVLGLLVIIPAIVWIIHRALPSGRGQIWFELESQRMRLDELAEQMKKAIALLQEIQAGLPQQKKVSADAIIPETGLR